MHGRGRTRCLPDEYLVGDDIHLYDTVGAIDFTVEVVSSQKFAHHSILESPILATDLSL